MTCCRRQPKDYEIRIDFISCRNPAHVDLRNSRCGHLVENFNIRRRRNLDCRIVGVAEKEEKKLI